MGGQLKLDSEPGKGSSFEFTIVTTVRSTETLVQPGSLQGKTVRVAEANQSCCKAIDRVLRHAGAQITEDQLPSVIIGADVTIDDGPTAPPVVRLLPLGSSESGRRQASAILRKPVAARDLVRACLAATETTARSYPKRGLAI